MVVAVDSSGMVYTADWKAKKGRRPPPSRLIDSVTDWMWWNVMEIQRLAQDIVVARILSGGALFSLKG